MNYGLRTVATIQIGDSSEDTIMISGRLHGPDRCICAQCSALESTAVMVAELLRPGESRQIAIADSPLFLIVRRHQPFSPRFGRSRLGTGLEPRSEHCTARTRGGMSLFLKR